VPRLELPVQLERGKATRRTARPAQTLQDATQRRQFGAEALEGNRPAAGLLRNDACFTDGVEFAREGLLVAQRYILTRKIGSGGMGSVWLAHDKSLDRVCALKLLDPDKLRDPEVLARFAREARTTAQIRSVNVVEIFEHGIWNGVPFIVMEFLEGEDLGAELDRLGKLRPHDAYSIVAQVARGLVRAHALGIVHRDLKPENIFLVPEDGKTIVKVLDFGIAHHDTYSPRDHATKAGAIMGTPCYMSPEQALGKPTDWRSDLWTLGVLCFQCLTGRLPFTHDALGGLMLLILQAPIPKIREANSELPQALEAFWQRAAERDPERRFQSAGELSDALGAAMGIDEMLAVPSTLPCSVHISSANEHPWTAPSDGAIRIVGRRASDAPVALTTANLISRFRSRWRRPALWFWGIAAIGSSLALLIVARRFEVVARGGPETSTATLLPPSVSEQPERSSGTTSFETSSAPARAPVPVAVSAFPLDELPPTCNGSPSSPGKPCVSSKQRRPPPQQRDSASLRKRGPTTPKLAPKTETLRNGSRDYGI
jgi:serine/threonine protein kinase